MAALGKKARVAHVWLTALLTLFAGLPRVQCRCPDGRVKPFCLGPCVRADGSPGCCCAGAGTPAACCAAETSTPAEDAEPPCCACAHHLPGEDAAEDTPRL